MRQIFLGIMTLLTLSFSVPSYAQTNLSSTTSLRRSIATIIFCGVGGAVLGISTLSFYGDPQNHIGNITTGLALGLIGGTTYITMNTVQTAESQKEALSLDPVLDLKLKNANPKPSLAWAWDF